MSGQEQRKTVIAKDETKPVKDHDCALPQDELRLEIENALEGMQYGEVKIVVRDGRIVQIERTTRNRPSSAKKTHGSDH